MTKSKPEELGSLTPADTGKIPPIVKDKFDFKEDIESVEIDLIHA